LRERLPRHQPTCREARYPSDDVPAGAPEGARIWPLKCEATRVCRRTQPPVPATAARPVLDRVAERRRAAALARHYRDAEQLPIAEIARRLGRDPATVKAYLYDPTGDKARAVKARYCGYCRTCGADTSPRNGKGDAYLYCRRCRPGAATPQWDGERVREAMRRWAELYGRAPTSCDWSRTHARRRGAQPMKRLERGDWPAPATVSGLYGTWAAPLLDAFDD
jgi:hypothetical protein